MSEKGCPKLVGISNLVRKAEVCQRCDARAKCALLKVELAEFEAACRKCPFGDTCKHGF